jgi:hypothetical protein
VSLVFDADRLENGEKGLVERFRKQFPLEGFFRFLPPLVDDDQIGLLQGGLNPRVEEGWLFGKFIEEHPHGFQQLLTAPVLHPDEDVQC